MLIRDKHGKRRRIGPVSLATIFAVLVAGWIISGQFGSAPDSNAADGEAKPAGTAAESDAANPKTTRVRTRVVTAQPYAGKILIIGHTEPNRQVQLRSEVAGTVAEVLVSQGARIKAGEIAVRVDADEMPARLAEADARVEQRKIEYAAARKLADKGFQAETKRAAAFANLRAASATQEQIRRHLEGAEIAAPFDGILNRRYVEVGDYLKIGDRVGDVVDLDPLIITAFVSERDYFSLAVGRAAGGRLSDGTAMRGRIRYISAAAELATRTFRVELEIPNPDFSIASGLTAEMSIPKPAQLAHIFAPSLFTLDKDGQLGVKVVTPDKLARFIPVSIIGIVDKNVVVTGLPDVVTLIVVGQEFVADGEPVVPVAETDVPGKNS